MALVKCAECQKEISDRADSCPHCGCPNIARFALGEETLNGISFNVIKLFDKYKKSGNQKVPVATDIATITGCSYATAMELVKKYEKHLFNPNDNPHKEAEYLLPPAFDGIYKVSITGKKTEVYCPKCKSSKCVYFEYEKVIPAQIKTKYSANLNPFKPFTLLNKNEKIISPEKIRHETKIKCEKCGFIFK